MLDKKLLKRVFECIFRKDTVKQNPLALHYNLIKLKKEFGINLPELYIEMLKVSDGGKTSTLYIPNPRLDLCKTDMFSIAKFHGLKSGHQTIKSAKLEMKEHLIDHWLGDFANYFFDFIEASGKSVDLFKLKKVLPHYLFRYDDTSTAFQDGNRVMYAQCVDRKALCRLYDDEAFIHRMNAEIGEVPVIDNRTVNGIIRGSYEAIMMFKNAYEFATFDGHDSICFYYGDKNRKEPSIWYINTDIAEGFEIAENFVTFLYNLQVERNSFNFTFPDINQEILDFLKDLLYGIFGESQFTLSIDELIVSANGKSGYSLSEEGKFHIEIARNKYFGCNGYRVPTYKEVEWVFELMPSDYGRGEDSVEKFICSFETKILEVYNKHKCNGIRLLNKAGIHNFIDEIRKAYSVDTDV